MDQFQAEAEEKRLMAEAKSRSAAMFAESYGKPCGNYVPLKQEANGNLVEVGHKFAMKKPLDCRQDDEPLFMVKVPKAFTITLDRDQGFCRLPIGIYEAPRSIAQHFYAKLNGLEIMSVVPAA